jgi:exosortase/archaeosortase family protein
MSSHETEEPAAGRPDDAPPHSEGGGWRGFVSRNRALIRHWTIFLVIIGFLVAASEIWSYWVNVRLSEWTAQLMGVVMRTFGYTTHVDGINVVNPVCRFRIIGECTAYFPMSIYVAAVAAYPCKISRRLLGILIGIPVLLLINQVRLVSLCFIIRSYPDYFEMAHVVVWQSLIIFFTVFLWVVWVSTLARGHETA